MGFNEIGVHAFEMLYFLVFSLVLIATLKDYYKYSFTSSFVPILTVGIYYASAGAWHLTQLEALVGFPIFLTIWFTYQSSKSERYDNKLLFFSGFIAGIVILFKLLFLPIVISFWTVAVLDAVIRKKQTFIDVILNIVIPIIIGISIPLLISILYFARFDVLNLLYQTFIEYPPRIFRETPHAEIGRLFHGIRWFTTRYAAIILLGSIGIYISFRRSIDLITIYITSWIVIGFLIILLQQQSWWEYHYQLLFVPFGIIALRSIELCWDKTRNLSFLRSSQQKVFLLIIVLSPLFVFPLTN